MGFLAIFTTSFVAWIIIALINAKMGILNKYNVDFGIAKKHQFWLIVLIGGLATGFLGEALAGVGLTTVSADGEIVTGDSFAVSDVTWADGVINDNDTGHDYYSDSDRTVTLYVDDGMVADNGQINATLTVDREQSKNAGSIEMSCTSPDFSKSGTIYNIISKDTDDDIELTIENGGKSIGNTVTKNVDYAEGDSTESVRVSYKMDESADDILSTKDSKTITCSIGDKTAKIIHVVNN